MKYNGNEDRQKVWTLEEREKVALWNEGEGNNRCSIGVCLISASPSPRSTTVSSLSSIIPFPDNSAFENFNLHSTFISESNFQTLVSSIHNDLSKHIIYSQYFQSSLTKYPRSFPKRSFFLSKYPEYFEARWIEIKSMRLKWKSREGSFRCTRNLQPASRIIIYVR